MNHGAAETTRTGARLLRPWQQLTAIAAATGIIAAMALVTSASPVAAYESATNRWSGGAVTMPSGLTISTTTTGGTSVSAAGTTQGLFAATSAMFTPSILTTTHAFKLSVSGANGTPTASTGV